MTDMKKDWRDGVVFKRAGALAETRQAGGGRATVFDYAGTGGAKTWIGSVTIPPGVATGLHHHGRHEVTIYIVRGTTEIRWGANLEYVADAGPGDFVYFTPNVPHQERNPSATEPVELVAVRSDNERIAVKLGDTPVDKPERVY